MTSSRILFEELNDKPDVGVTSRAKKVRDFYRTGMDVAKRNEQGAAPLELFALVDGVKNVGDLAGGRTTHRSGVDAWWAPQSRS